MQPLLHLNSFVFGDKYRHIIIALTTLVAAFIKQRELSYLGCHIWSSSRENHRLEVSLYHVLVVLGFYQHFANNLVLAFMQPIPFSKPTNYVHAYGTDDGSFP